MSSVPLSVPSLTCRSPQPAPSLYALMLASPPEQGLTDGLSLLALHPTR